MRAKKIFTNTWFIFAVILAGGIILRSVLFGSHPGGLNQDEASMGYDAWALLHYGVDRNGQSCPVHFIILEKANINRVNAIYLPMIVFTAMGISEVLQRKKFGKFAPHIIAGMYAVYAIVFVAIYFAPPYTNRIANAFHAPLEPALAEAVSLAGPDETIYIQTGINSQYTLVLFYLKIPPEDYFSTVQFEDLDVMFQQVQSFGRFVFLPTDAERVDAGVYILPDYSVTQTNL